MTGEIRDPAVRLPLRDQADVAAARQRTRELARAYPFRRSDVEALATAVSEIAHNVIVHAGGGEFVVTSIESEGRVGVVAIARDNGPGIASVEEAMRDGYSTGNGLGLGLPSARRLVDEFELQTVVGEGTSVRLTKWAR